MLKRVLSIGIVVALSMFVLTGCNSRKAPVYSVEQAPVELKKGKTEEDVYQAIKRAGANLGWVITKSKPGLAQGQIVLRKHMATVEIPYDTKTYSIHHKSSVELDYDPATNTIHKNYNGWIQNLDKAIQIQLNLLRD